MGSSVSCTVDLSPEKKLVWMGRTARDSHSPTQAAEVVQRPAHGLQLAQRLLLARGLERLARGFEGRRRSARGSALIVFSLVCVASFTPLRPALPSMLLVAKHLLRGLLLVLLQRRRPLRVHRRAPPSLLVGRVRAVVAKQVAAAAVLPVVVRRGDAGGEMRALLVEHEGENASPPVGLRRGPRRPRPRVAALVAAAEGYIHRAAQGGVTRRHRRRRGAWGVTRRSASAEWRKSRSLSSKKLAFLSDKKNFDLNGGERRRAEVDQSTGATLSGGIFFSTDTCRKARTTCFRPTRNRDKGCGADPRFGTLQTTRRTRCRFQEDPAGREMAVV
jgi:hypothetical protein